MEFFLKTLVIKQKSTLILSIHEINFRLEFNDNSNLKYFIGLNNRENQCHVLLTVSTLITCNLKIIGTYLPILNLEDKFVVSNYVR